ncbi:Hypothetical predicted protein [Paramuricea clavata]|uniref:Uncharacterized protein n=1 Tax=Paramuricea clavata TaxID=317549 RepID=A0A7D9DZ55_PARCT|nr:Hypothetical predicted protein [Paramuricea clavata]
MADASDSVSGSEDEFNSPESPGPSTLKQSSKSTRKDSGAANPVTEKTMRAEVKVATMLVQHNIPLAVADELTPLFQDIFSDSEIAKNYSSRRTKTACIINGAVAPFFQQSLVEHVKNNPFSIAINGSSDNAVEKMNPLTVRIFYVSVYILSFIPFMLLI